MVRLKNHPEAQYFDLTAGNIVKFFIRLLAFTTFDFLGEGILTGNFHTHLITHTVGFFAMLYAVGPFAFMVLFKFIVNIPGVQYPFGVPLYFAAVMAWEIHQIRMARLKKSLKGEV